MVTIFKSSPWWAWSLIAACSGAAGWWVGAHSLAVPGSATTARAFDQKGEAFPWGRAETSHVDGLSNAVRRADPMPISAEAHVALEPACVVAVPLRAGPASDLSKVMRGTDEERYQALVAQQNDGGVSEATLKALYESDASSPVRLLAFDLALQAYAGNAMAMRDALQAARLMPDAVISMEASRRLDALAAFDKAQAAAPQGQSPH